MKMAYTLDEIRKLTEEFYKNDAQSANAQGEDKRQALEAYIRSQIPKLKEIGKSVKQFFGNFDDNITAGGISEALRKNVQKKPSIPLLSFSQNTEQSIDM